MDQFTKPDDIRCLEYVSESAQLLMGTDTDHGDITTHDIKDYINFFDSDMPRIADREHNNDADDYGDEQQQTKDPYGDDYDVMEGKDVNAEVMRLIK